MTLSRPNLIESASIEKVKALVNSGQEFCVFSLPSSQQINLILKGHGKQQVGEFVFTPFSMQSEAATIRFQAAYNGPLSEFESERDHSRKKSPTKQRQDEDFSKKDYLKAINYLKSEIDSSELTKVVLSRTETLESIYSSVDLFQKAVEVHQTAFVYLYHSAKGTTWVGATPELLLERNGARLKTMSLAGTKTCHQHWTSKEEDEQLIVTEFIINELKLAGCSGIEVDERSESKAGHLEHLRTDISFDSVASDEAILRALHPTPAVCGFPKLKALKLIHDIERHDREYYSGFIGISSLDNARYYVNLRCARFSDNEMTFFAGGGITAESDAEKEWKETELKIETLSQLL